MTDSETKFIKRVRNMIGYLQDMVDINTYSCIISEELFDKYEKFIERINEDVPAYKSMLKCFGYKDSLIDAAVFYYKLYQALYDVLEMKKVQGNQLCYIKTNYLLEFFVEEIITGEEQGKTEVYYTTLAQQEYMIPSPTIRGFESLIERMIRNYDKEERFHWPLFMSDGKRTFITYGNAAKRYVEYWSKVSDSSHN